MASTAGGPFGGLLNDPALFERLLNSFGSIGRFLAAPPGPSLGANALRDLGQIGATAPLGVPGAVGLSALGEGMRPPWEQSPLRVPMAGLSTASDLSKLALRDPMMLQKLATSALLGGPSAFSQAFHEHPVLTPLMAIPILPGGARFGRDDWMGQNARVRWGELYFNSVQEALKSGKSMQESFEYARNKVQNAMNLSGKALENAVRRVSGRERRIQRKLTQHEVEDVIAQAMSEAKPSTYVENPAEASRRKYLKWTDKDLQERLDQLSTAPPLYDPIKAALRFEIERRSAPPSQAEQVSREELLHQFEEGPPGPLPPAPPMDPNHPIALKEYFAGLSDQELLRQWNTFQFSEDTYKKHPQLLAQNEAKRQEIIRRGLMKPSDIPPIKGVSEGGAMLKQVTLPKHKQNWQQGIVHWLNRGMGDPMLPSNSISEDVYWQGGQAFVKGPKGWMMEPRMFIPPIKQIAGQTILPRPDGSIGRFIDKTVWKPLFPQEIEGTDRMTRESPNLELALDRLKLITGNPRVAQFWLMQHIHNRKLAGTATPAEIVWFELQRRPPGDGGMAGAKR